MKVRVTKIELIGHVVVENDNGEPIAEAKTLPEVFYRGNLPTLPSVVQRIEESLSTPEVLQTLLR